MISLSAAVGSQANFRPAGFWAGGIDLALKLNYQPVLAHVDRSNALGDRLVLLASLRPGWDGPGSAAPPRSALSVVWSATQDFEGQADLGVSAHADGFIALTVEGHDRRKYADVYDDRVEYEFVSSAGAREWTSPLDADELKGFLAADD